MNLGRAAALPVVLAARALGDVAALAGFAREFNGWAGGFRDQADALIAIGRSLERIGQDTGADMEEILEVGERNAAVGREMVEVAREGIAANRQANARLASLDAHIVELLEFVRSVEGDLPALRTALGTVESLNDSASALSEAAPPVQAAAERVDRLASRIPGLRGAPS